jgi:hypothetical protein
MPIGSDYTVEAQLTGQEVVGSLQFEITPSTPAKLPQQLYINHKLYPRCTPPGSYLIYVMSLTGKKITIPCSPSDTIERVKMSLLDKQGTPPNKQRLIFQEEQLQNGKLNEYLGEQRNTNYLRPNLGRLRLANCKNLLLMIISPRLG